MIRFFAQLWRFGMQQALSCLFPAAIFAALFLLQIAPIPHVPRYDAMLIICIALQWLMVRTKLETLDELKVICVFHLIGLALELYKVRMGSWTYPQDAYTKIGGVPLYSGFMYASVASYLCQAWRRLDVEVLHWPRSYFTVPLGAAIYLNFMTHHYIPDLRWVLTALLFAVFVRTSVTFRVGGARYGMPLTLSFLLIGFFVWLAENIGTFLGAWRYPNQEAAWTFVSLGKLSSWFLLVIVSFIIVAQLKHVKRGLSRRSGVELPPHA
ncbi:hypothetical protein SD70_02775 [Gordoniibacillus kamchatkensis]|uniref:DUF817 domain-containing protein n=1 Tax=Gordoniibacillus kamchatkensis TaxID=1590651 RepID=A0ABR5AM68_9BACL|nr:DUF817 domain-containing protein [Paenibacillus sp. VKM B-2647]KIL42118.1 hypothetical protein SD70_02775 [Paenibacillus sp. VKM B-2647]